MKNFLKMCAFALLAQLVHSSDVEGAAQRAMSFEDLKDFKPVQSMQLSPAPITIDRDEEGLSSCSARPCHHAVDNHPAGVPHRIGRLAMSHAAFAIEMLARLPELNFRGHLSFAFATAWSLAAIPKMALSVGFRIPVSLLILLPCYGASTLPRWDCLRLDAPVFAGRTLHDSLANCFSNLSLDSARGGNPSDPAWIRSLRGIAGELGRIAARDEPGQLRHRFVENRFHAREVVIVTGKILLILNPFTSQMRGLEQPFFSFCLPGGGRQINVT
jgi:hypothetical protein